MHLGNGAELFGTIVGLIILGYTLYKGEQKIKHREEEIEDELDFKD